MRLSSLLLFCILALMGGCVCGRAADLVAEVPLDAPAYAQLNALAQRQLLSPSRAGMLTDAPARVLTRYDFGLMLIEPLQRFIALWDAQSAGSSAPEQRRRAELTYRAVAPLTSRDLDDLLAKTNELLATFRDVIEELSPGLSRRAALALFELGKAEHRPWMRALPLLPISREDLNVSMALQPKTPAEPFGSPLPLLPRPHSTPALALLADSEAAPALVLSRPADTLQAAMAVEFSRLRVYGTLSTLPGDEPLSLLKIDSGRRATLGFRVDFGNLKEIGISGLLEYHVMRSGDPANPNIDRGAVTGVAVTW
jgi:hypothetical protein